MIYGNATILLRCYPVSGVTHILLGDMAEAHRNGRRILVVDDDPRLVRIVSLYLDMEGYDVQQATNAKDGLQAVADAPPDLVIMDIMMTDMDGIEACRQIRDNPATRTLPVLMFSALAGKDDVERARDAGANHLITKPYNLDGLNRVIESLLDSD